MSPVPVKTFPAFLVDWRVQAAPHLHRLSPLHQHTQAVGFVAQRGSWNHSKPSGYRVLRVRYTGR